MSEQRCGTWGICTSLMACVSLLFGCGQDQVISMSGIEVKDVRPVPPEFKREYRKSLSDGRMITITMRSWLFGGRRSNGELTQANGRWVLFDIDRIADKIIDPQLVPLVEEAVRQIVAIDNEYMKSSPSEFTDSKGQHWVRR